MCVEEVLLSRKDCSAIKRANWHNESNLPFDTSINQICPLCSFIPNLQIAKIRLFLLPYFSSFCVKIIMPPCCRSCNQNERTLSVLWYDIRIFIYGTRFLYIGNSLHSLEMYFCMHNIVLFKNIFWLKRSLFKNKAVVNSNNNNYCLCLWNMIHIAKLRQEKSIDCDMQIGQCNKI